MNTVSLAQQTTINSTQSPIKSEFIGDRQTYLKTQKVLLWFTLSAGTIFIATGIFIF